MRTSIEIVTPALAAEYLLANTANRPCSTSRVAFYSGAMKRGEWMLNGDSIRFAKSGTLLDGQARLRACIHSGVAFETVVMRDLPEETFKTIDGGKKRSLSDILVITGEVNTTRLARALRCILLYESGSFSGLRFTPQQIEAALKKHPGIRDWMSAASAAYKITGHASLIAALLYLASLTRPQEAEDFMQRLVSGENLEKGSPILTLRDRLQQDRVTTGKLPDSYVAQLTIYAFNAFVRGDRRAILKGTRNSSELPRLVL